MEDVKAIEEKIEALGAERDQWKAEASRLAEEITTHQDHEHGHGHDKPSIAITDGETQDVSARIFEREPHYGQHEGDRRSHLSDNAVSIIKKAMNKRHVKLLRLATLAATGFWKKTSPDEILGHVPTFDEFEFMKDITNRDWFTTHEDFQYPGKGFDFGDGGYTASVNMGHELIQLTAVDDRCGVVWVRGSFSNNPNAFLARAQRKQGNKSTFGVKVVPDSGPYTVDYEDPGDVGFLNFRFPYADYAFKSEDSETGRCVMFSFIRDKTVFQVLRFEPGDLVPAKDTDPKIFEGGLKSGAVLKAGSIKNSLRGETAASSAQERKVRVRAGGRLRFGCGCVSGHSTQYRISSKNDVFSCNSDTYMMRLDMQIFVNGKRVPITAEEKTLITTEVDAFFEQDVILNPGKLSIVVVTFSLRAYDSNVMISDLPTSADLCRDLGAVNSSLAATDRLWMDQIDINISDDFYDLATSATCLEQILNVTSVPMKMHRIPPSNPNSRPASIVPGMGNRDQPPNEIDQEQTLQDLQNGTKHNIETNDQDKIANPQDSSRKVTSLEDGGKLDDLGVHSQVLDDPDLGIALIRNIAGWQLVDLEHSFLQIRFLVKVYKFLEIDFRNVAANGRPKEPPNLKEEASSLEESTSISNIRDSCLRKIAYHLHHSLVWIVNVRIEDAYSPLSPACAPFKKDARLGHNDDDPESDRTEILYITISIWYIMHNCSDVLPESFFKHLRENVDRIKGRLREEARVEFAAANQGTNYILLWYAFACLNKIYQRLAEIPGAEGLLVVGTFSDVSALTRQFQKKAEKFMMTAMKIMDDGYTEKDELTSRLALLGHELGLSSKETNNVRTRKILARRKPTTVLNPGKSLPGREIISRIVTSSPWELDCLNHHIRLASWHEDDVEDQETVRANCLRFLTASYQFVKSWDLSRSDVAFQWWDLKASCIVCSTLLDMRMRTGGQEAPQAEDDTQSPAQNPKRQSIAAKPLSPTLVVDTQALGETNNEPKGDTRGKGEEDEDSFREQFMKLIDKQNEFFQASRTDKSNDVAPFVWQSYQPEGLFHPQAWVQSLDDTPELFRSAQTKTVQLRNQIQTYLSTHERRRSSSAAGATLDNILTAPDWTSETISDQFPEDELLTITVYDIGLSEFGHWRSQRGRLAFHPLSSESNPEYVFNWSIRQTGNSYGLSKADVALELWIAFLDGSLLDTNGPHYSRLSEHIKSVYSALPLQDRLLLADKMVLLKAKQKLKLDLLGVLNDSLVDLNTRYRIFFTQRCTPHIVKAFIYMWHTNTIDTFDDYFRNSSHFFDSENRTWISSISVSYWNFRKTDTSDRDLFDEQRYSAEFPPSGIINEQSEGHRWKKMLKRDKQAVKTIEEGSSSLIISSDAFGHFWTCSIVSPILSEILMERCVEEVREILDIFSHQARSGRCLIFLAFLGALCESLSKQYDEILQEMQEKIGLGVGGLSVLKDGLVLQQGDDAVKRLEALMWALEALRVFDDRLRDSIDKINEAKERMQRYINAGPGRRQERLERYCRTLLENFDKRYGRLDQIRTKIDALITQITRYREGIATITNLKDTHIALKQNETIRILTYITIFYLPISFAAAVFSMSIVTNLDWGGNVFGGFVVAALALTFLLAGSLEPIIKLWDKYVMSNMPWRRSEVEYEKATRGEKGVNNPPQAQQSPREWPKLGPVRRRTVKTVNGSVSPEKPAEDLDGK